MKQTTIKKIESVTTLNEYLDVLESEFKTEECKPGRLTKGIVINMLTAKLTAQNPILIQGLKVKALEADSIKSFIKTIRSNYNGEQNLSDLAKAQLVENTQRLMGLTRLQENDGEKKAPATKAPAKKVATKKAPAKKVAKRRK